MICTKIKGHILRARNLLTTAELTKFTMMKDFHYVFDIHWLMHYWAASTYVGNTCKGTDQVRDAMQEKIERESSSGIRFTYNPVSIFNRVQGNRWNIWVFKGKWTNKRYENEENAENLASQSLRQILRFSISILVAELCERETHKCGRKNSNFFELYSDYYNKLKN